MVVPTMKKAYPLLSFFSLSHGISISVYVPSSATWPDNGAPALANVDRRRSNNFCFFEASTTGTLSTTRTLSNPSRGETAYLEGELSVGVKMIQSEDVDVLKVSTNIQP
jgi:hypothetical protein